MKQKLLSVLLVLAMALTLLPTAAFAEETGKTDPVVAGYGFLWESPTENTTLTGGFKPGNDWMGETMYVAFAENGLTKDTNLWFEVTAGSDVWGCAATADGTHNMFAFSFLNRTTQWEQHPESISVGADQSHAKKYLADKNDVSSVTLKVYVTESAFTSESHDVKNLTPFFDKSVAITSGQDTMVEVNDTSATTPAITATPATLHDTRTEGAIADADLCKNYKLDTTATGTIKIMAADLREHQNGDTPETMGYWVGISFAPADGYTLKYKDKNGEFQADAEDGKVNYYWNAKNYLSTGATVTLASFQGEKQVGEEVTYKIDFSGVTLYEAPPTAGTLTFSTLLDAEVADGKIFGKAPSSLGKFEVTEGTGADAGKITVTGTANYISGWAEFNGDPAAKENDGHYLPIQIKGVEGQKITIKGANEKTLTFGEDGSLELVMFLDKLTKSKFTVTVGEVETSSKKVGDIYTIDLSGVTLLPKTVEGTNVESKPGQDGSVGTVEVSKDGNKVVIPGDLSTGTASDKVELGQMIVKVDAVKNNANVAVDEDTPADVKTAIKGNDSKIVEVTIKKVGGAGEENLFSDGLPENKQITVTISGLTDGATYHVFCIKDDGSVSYYGYKTVSGTTLDVKTSHLCHFAAVKETDAVKEAVKTMAVEPNTGLEGSAGGTVTPPATTSTYTRTTDTALNKVTINGKAGTYYVVQATNAKNSAPGLIYCIKADATTGKAEVRCNASSVLLVLEGTTTEPVFTNGIPNGLTEVKEAPKG